MQGVLNVTSTGDAKLADDIQCGSTKHLVLFIAKGLGRSYYDTVSGMNADRVKVLHVTYGNHVACAVAHYLVLDFFPSGDAALYQDLSHTGKTQAVFQDLTALFRVLGNTAAASAQGVCRTKHDRVTDLVCDAKAVLYVLYDVRRSHRLANLLHGLFEHLTVFGLFDGQGRGTDEADVVLFQEACLFQLHGKV